MSVRRTLLLVVFVLAAAMVPVRAQETPQPQQPQPPKPLNQNVRVDETIALKGDAKPVTKTLSMVTSDRQLTKGRAGIEIPVAEGPIVKGPDGAQLPVSYRYRGVGVNVDATPTILDSSRVMLRLNWQFNTVYKAEGSSGQQPSFGQGANEIQGVVFDSGKPVVVTQSTDGETGREYTVTVTATILK